MKLGLNTPFITLLDAILLVVFGVITIFTNSNSMSMIIGILILLVAIVGFVGALKNKRFFLLVFFAACAMLAIYQIVWIVTQIIGGNAPAVAFPVFVTLALLIGTGLGYRLWRMTPEADKSKDIEKGKEERIPEPPKPQVAKTEEPKSQESKPQEPTDVKIQA